MLEKSTRTIKIGIYCLLAGMTIDNVSENREKSTRWKMNFLIKLDQNEEKKIVGQNLSMKVPDCVRLLSRAFRSLSTFCRPVSNDDQ